MSSALAFLASEYYARREIPVFYPDGRIPRLESKLAEGILFARHAFPFPRPGRAGRRLRPGARMCQQLTCRRKCAIFAS